MTRIASLFPFPVGVAQAIGESSIDELFPEERAYVEGAVEKRRNEFAAGRRCAREALRQIGVPPSPILRSADRAPIWPDGVVGTISHTRGFCAAVVASRAHALGVGLDVEHDEPLKADLERLICTPPELRALARHGAAERGAIAKIVFSVKEAFYKSQYPTTGEFLDFRDVDVTVSPENGLWRVDAIRHPDAAVRAFEGVEGRFFVEGGYVVSGIGIPAR